MIYIDIYVYIVFIYYNYKYIVIIPLISLLRADCSNADKPGAVPQHNGLTDFGKVRYL